MSEFTVTRTLKGPAREGLAGPHAAQPLRRLAARQAGDGGARRADRRVLAGDRHLLRGREIALTGRYDEVSEPDRLVMTVPGDAVTAITLTSAPDDSTRIAYAFDVDESMHAMVTESVDEVLGRVSTVLAGIAWTSVGGALLQRGQTDPQGLACLSNGRV